MASIAPFTGIRYDSRSVPHLADVVAPPYDVLSKADMAALHAASGVNIAHLTRPETYASAGKLWNEWRSTGVLTQDRPSMYLYRQSFVDPETGVRMPERTGLVCALHLEAYESRGVLPHENTIAAHRADRLDLMRATHANLESIYGLYSDESGHAAELLRSLAADAPAVAAVEGRLGSDHTLQRIDDPGALTALTAAMAGKAILIADGHHRYETALAYRGERPDEPGSGAILTTLTAFEDQGLLVLPTHRMVRGVPAELIALLPDRLRQAGFDVFAIGESEPAAGPGTLGFDLLLQSGERLRAVLGSDVAPYRRISGPQSDAWKSLDVAVLHKLVLEDILQIPVESLSATDQVRYTRDSAEAAQSVRSGEFQMAFLLSRPVVAAIRAVSSAGDRMPQKSTFFYPKLLSGLVMRSTL